MSWLAAAALAGSLYSAQPAPEPVAVAVDMPAAATACVPTVLPVTVDNTQHAARDVKLNLFAPDALVEFEREPGNWQRLHSEPADPRDPQSLQYYLSKVVHLPDHASAVFRYRVAFGSGVDVPLQVTASEHPAQPFTPPPDMHKIAVDGPTVLVDNPVPARVNLGEQQEFRAHIQNRANLAYPSLTVQVSSSNPPSDKRRGAKGWRVETRAGRQTWEPLTFSEYYGWSGNAPFGGLAPGEQRDLGVRYETSLEQGRFPFEIRVTAGKCVVSVLNQKVDFVQAPPPGPVVKGMRGMGGFRLGAVIAALLVVAGWLLVPRLRNRRSLGRVPKA
jgi:hypothetical protein